MRSREDRNVLIAEPGTERKGWGVLLDFALQYAARGWPVFRLGAAKVPLKGSHGHRDATTDPDVIRRWWTERPRANIGLATGAIVVIDPDGPSALEALRAAGAAHGGWPRTLTAKTPRSIHLYYLAPPGIEVRSFNSPRAVKGADGIDIKGAGGYVCLPPSRIKTNGQWLDYQWLVDAPIAPLPDWALGWIDSLKGPQNQAGNNEFAGVTLPAHLQERARKRAARQGDAGRRERLTLAVPWSPADEERIRSALAAIPATGYDRWVQVGMALHSLGWERSDGSSAAFELFNAWSATEPDLYALEATEEKWASFGRTGRTGIGLGTLFHRAEACGWTGNAAREVQPEQEVMPYSVGHGAHNAPPHPVNGSQSAAAPGGANIFGEPMTGTGPAVNGASLNGHAAAEPLLPGVLQPVNPSPLIELNRDYAVIGDVGSKCLVLGWVPSKVDDSVRIPSFQTFKSFQERYGNRYVVCRKTEETEEAKQLGAAWLKWRHRRSYDGIDMAPGQPATLPGNLLNLWCGFAIAPAPGRWERMKAHIAEVLAGGNADALAYILRWAAWTVQNPAERAEVALVFRGEKGAGKGSFAHALRRVFGQHGLYIANSKHLVGAFNAHLRNCLLLYADEAFWAGDKQGESVLKALITEPVQMIEQKGVDAAQWRNRIHLVMTANAEWVVPASHDERRFAMFDVSSAHARDASYFAALHAELNAGGLAAMLHDLLQLELGDWHPRRIPNTEALRQQKIRSMGQLAEWWEGLLQSGTIAVAEKTTPDVAMAQYLINHVRDYAPRAKDLTPAALGRFLSEKGCVKLHRANGNFWRFPPLNEARAAWEKHYNGWRWDAELTEWQARS